MILVSLFGWPVITAIMSRFLPWPNVIVASLIGGYLLLPVQGGLDLPLLPALDKSTIPCLTLFCLALITRPGESSKFGQAAPEFAVQNGWLPRSATGNVLLLFIVAGAFSTALTNTEPLRFTSSPRTIPGLSLYDGFSIIVRSTDLIVPLLLGRKYLANSWAHRLILMGFVFAGLGYSLLALFEARMSPQLNIMVYGFFPHNWQQHIRGGGFRPIVFLQHGLWLAIFFAMTILAALGLSRTNKKSRFRWLCAAGWLMLTLILCNSLGAAIIAIALAPLILFFGPRFQLLFGGVAAAIVISYPILRGADIIPTEQIVSAVQEYNTGRALSLNFRFENEDSLIVKANEKPFFGWGSFGRNRIYDEFGRDLSVVDGAWIVSIGQGGWLRYLGEFGLLSVPLILFAVRRRRYEAGLATAALCLVLASNMIDMLPNASRTPLTWLIVGALIGRLELAPERKDEPEIETATVDQEGGLSLAESPVSPYTRQRVLHQRRPSIRER